MSDDQAGPALPVCGTLYIVATPIGNLEDISPRALRVLGEASLIAAEDTRVTRKLLTHFGVRTPIVSYHSHSSPRHAEQVLDRLASGGDVALVSDAGTPGISDPGAGLVREALARGLRVVPIPGPSAVIAAVCASGLDPTRFVFEGFLPRGRGDQRKVLAGIVRLPHTLVFYEASPRLVATLGALAEDLGDRPCAVGRELTKKFEEFVRGTLSEVGNAFRAREPRGECVIVVAGCAVAERASEDDAIARLKQLLAEGASVRDAARAAAEELELPRRELYELALRLGS